MVPTKRAIKLQEKIISAIKFKNGVRRDEKSYLAILHDIDEEEKPQEDMPREIVMVLEEFKDVAPTKLPKELPPRGEINHKIELESG